MGEESTALSPFCPTPATAKRATETLPPTGAYRSRGTAPRVPPAPSVPSLRAGEGPHLLQGGLSGVRERDAPLLSDGAAARSSAAQHGLLTTGWTQLAQTRHQQLPEHGPSGLAASLHNLVISIIIILWFIAVYISQLQVCINSFWVGKTQNELSFSWMSWNSKKWVEMSSTHSKNELAQPTHSKNEFV